DDLCRARFFRSPRRRSGERTEERGSSSPRPTLPLHGGVGGWLRLRRAAEYHDLPFGPSPEPRRGRLACKSNEKDSRTGVDGLGRTSPRLRGGGLLRSPSIVRHAVP